MAIASQLLARILPPVITYLRARLRDERMHRERLERELADECASHRKTLEECVLLREALHYRNNKKGPAL